MRFIRDLTLTSTIDKIVIISEGNPLTS
jgi:hypothetical protein